MSKCLRFLPTILAEGAPEEGTVLPSSTDYSQDAPGSFFSQELNPDILSPGRGGAENPVSLAAGDEQL